MKTDTPRTDAELIRMVNDHCDGLYVSPDFARELERENARLREALAAISREASKEWDAMAAPVDIGYICRMADSSA